MQIPAADTASPPRSIATSSAGSILSEKPDHRSFADASWRADRRVRHESAGRPRTRHPALHLRRRDRRGRREHHDRMAERSCARHMPKAASAGRDVPRPVGQCDGHLAGRPAILRPRTRTITHAAKMVHPYHSTAALRSRMISCGRSGTLHGEGRPCRKVASASKAGSTRRACGLRLW